MSDSKTPRVYPLTLIGVTQQLRPELWQEGPAAWSSPQDVAAIEAAAATAGSEPALLRDGALLMLRRMAARFEAAGHVVTDAYGIIHDRDLIATADESGRPVQVPKATHIHTVWRFAKHKGPKGVDAAGALLGVAPNYVELPDSKRFGLDNMLSYLTHAKYVEKHQYPPEQVATLAGRAYLEIDAEQRPTWVTKGRANIKKRKVYDSAASVIDDIAYGRITREQVELDSDLYDVYYQNRQKCEDAFRAFAARNSRLRKTALKNGEYRKSTAFLMGPEQQGKSTVADLATTDLQMIAELAGQSWQVVEPAGTHAQESVGSAEVVYHDDMRAEMLPRYDEALRYFDPKRATEASGRNYSRSAPVPRVIMGSSSETLLSLAVRMARGARTNVDELLYRVGWYVEVSLAPDTPREVLTRDREITQEEWNEYVVATFHRIRRNATEPRTERVFDRDGVFVGEVTTRHETVPYAVIRGAAPAARFLAVEMIQRNSPDVAEAITELGMAALAEGYAGAVGQPALPGFEDEWPAAHIEDSMMPRTIDSGRVVWSSPGGPFTVAG